MYKINFNFFIFCKKCKKRFYQKHYHITTRKLIEEYRYCPKCAKEENITIYTKLKQTKMKEWFNCLK